MMGFCRIVAILMLFVSWPFFAMADKPDSVLVSNVSLKRVGDSVLVCFNIVIPSGKVKKRHRFVVQPVLYSSSGSLLLRKIYADGHIRTIIEWRRRFFGMPKVNGSIDSSDVRALPNVTLAFSQMVKLQQWMDSLSFKIDMATYRFRGKKAYTPEPLASNVQMRLSTTRYSTLKSDSVFVQQAQPKLSLTAVEIDRRESFVQKMDESEPTISEIKATAETSGLAVGFRTGVTRIEPSINGNKEVLDRFIAALNAIKSDSLAVIRKLVVVGYASPEGMAYINEQVALKRAESLRDYLTLRAAVPLDLFTLVNGGEDWGGLRRMVLESDLPDKEVVVRIIDEVPVLKGREKMLMDLKGGEVYRYMKQNMFPKLRNAGYLMVFYNSRGDANAELIARAKGLIFNEKYRDALDLLLTCQSSSDALYSIGLCYLRLNDTPNAERFFDMAVAAKADGWRDAEHILRRLRSVGP
jgi:outer membrane protein OmpA-like peptidoglycan-associated protein